MILHRPVQACVIGLLAALVTACALLTPLYQRALEQASVTVELDQAPASASQLHLTSTGVLPDIYSRNERAVPPLTPSELTRLVPHRLREYFRAPIAATSVVADGTTSAGGSARGPLVWRAGGCGQLSLTSGRCPTAAGEIAVSAADSANFGWRPGTVVPTAEVLPKGTAGPATTTSLTVTGVYARPTTRYWDGWALTGASGTQPDLQHVAHDSWVTADPTFRSIGWRNPVNQVDLQVDRAAVGVDELLRVGPAADTFQYAMSQRPAGVAGVRARSDLGALADRVREGRAQARETVPLLMLPLGILGVVVLWMALGSAAEQRRPEVALARLRGRGVRGARAHLLSELLVVTLLGVPFGAAAALGLDRLARHQVLPGHPPLELRLPVWVALVVAVAAVVATTVVTSARVSREPIAALLRRVPPRRTGWTLGTTDAVVLTAALAIVVGSATGRLTGPLALAAPAVLALALGLLLSRAIVPVATGAGRRLLRRGRPAAGVAVLQIARRPGTRGVIALLTVAAGILVFAGNAVAVGARNRTVAAGQQVGAPMVVTVGGGTAIAARDALDAAGVSAADVTPVVVQPAEGNDAQTNLFVEPEAFARIAVLPDGARDRLGALSGSEVTPVTLTGTRLTLELGAEGLDTGGQPVRLAVRLHPPDGAEREVSLGPLPGGTSRRTVAAPVPCPRSCVVTGWRVTAAPASSVTGRVAVTRAAIDGTPVALGEVSDWAESPHADAPGVQVVSADATSLVLALANDGRSDLLLQHRWVPQALPAVVTGALPDTSSRASFAGTGLDGADRAMHVVARIPWLPQSGRSAAVSSLGLAERSGAVLSQEAQLQLWFAAASDSLLTRVTRALEAHHLAVLGVARESEARAVLAQSPSAWSLQLGALVAVACLLVSGLGLVIAGTASWAARTRDLAVVRMNGMTARTVRQIALGEQVPAIVVGGVVGALAGVLATHLSLREVPLLPAAPPVDLLDLSVDWPLVAMLTGVAVLTGAGLGWLLGLLTARRAGVDRVLGAS